MIGLRACNLKTVTLCVLCLAAGICLQGCSQGKDRVLAIAKTRSYHTDTCPRIHMAHTQFMTAAQAKTLEYKACPGCKPDTKFHE
jgi:hypothetical protein